RCRAAVINSLCTLAVGRRGKALVCARWQRNDSLLRNFSPRAVRRSFRAGSRAASGRKFAVFGTPPSEKILPRAAAPRPSIPGDGVPRQRKPGAKPRRIRFEMLEYSNDMCDTNCLIDGFTSDGKGARDIVGNHALRFYSYGCGLREKGGTSTASSATAGSSSASGTSGGASG